MLIVQGDKILAQMKNVDVQMENVNFQVGQTYVIQNFVVESNSGQYKATHHAFKINFVKATKLRHTKYTKYLKYLRQCTISQCLMPL